MEREDELSNVIKLMVSSYEKNKNIMENIKKNDFLNIFNTYNPNEKIIESISIEKNQNLSFAGVDAGFVNQQFNFSNITIVKEVGALFEYQDSKLKHTTYFPKTYNLARPYLTTSSLELEEVMWNTSILRLNKEIGLSIDIVKNKKPNFMLLDGSIVPQYISKPSKDSKLFSIYKQLINNFVSLYNISKENKIYLVGCIEDSRSDSFFNFLKDKILNKQISNELYDSFVTFSLLKKNQRTCVFKYTDVSTEHPILKDFPKQFIDNLYICYIKLSEDDFPLRLEFIYFKEYGLTLKEYTDYIVSNISSISNFNKKYIYPAPLIEADLRSRLRKDEIESIITSVLERTRKYGFRLPRRENRMF